MHAKSARYAKDERTWPKSPCGPSVVEKIDLKVRRKLATFMQSTSRNRRHPAKTPAKHPKHAPKNQEKKYPHLAVYAHNNAQKQQAASAADVIQLLKTGRLLKLI